jgi:hypothetical protein
MEVENHHTQTQTQAKLTPTTDSSRWVISLPRLLPSPRKKKQERKRKRGKKNGMAASVAVGNAALYERV